MDSLQQRRADTFAKVLLFAQSWPAEMSSPAVQSVLAQLKSTYEAVLELDQRKGPSKGATDRTTQITAWTQELRRDHLMVLKTAARIHLRDDDGKPMALKVPPFKAKPADVLRAVEEFDARLRPHLATLISNGMPPDVLDGMKEAARHLERAIAEPSPITTHKALRTELNALISKGLALIVLLRRLLRKKLEDDPNFGEQFNTAAKVADKPGPARSKVTVTKMKERERRHRKQPVPRPRRT